MDWNKANVATVLIAVLVAIAAIIGGIVVIVDPDTLNFHEYLNELAKFAGAVGLLAIGRGILNKKH